MRWLWKRERDEQGEDDPAGFSTGAKEGCVTLRLPSGSVLHEF